MDLFEEDTPAEGNAPTLTVSEISGAVKRVIEGEFSRVRVRGEVGRVSRPGSGHLYFDLKDDKAVIASVCWKGQVARLEQRPEEGIEVIATGRLTTFPGQSKYQLIVEQVAPAGLGALMMMLEKRRKALADEGLFDAARKRPLPFLPEVIGVVTSLSGAVIRDILHRLRDRFPTHVLIWPVAVQGQGSAAEVAAAIQGFNAMAPGGPIPRPDLIIVARGGGSIEDLWGFNEEIVVRAAAGSAIPLISAVGHETDTTLIDHAADMRAPTPTAAAEMAVPVLADLHARVTEAGLRMGRAAHGRTGRARQALTDLGRAMGRAQALTDPGRQWLDLVGARLEPALAGLVARRRDRLAGIPSANGALRHFLQRQRDRLNDRGARIAPDAARRMAQARERLEGLSGRLDRARTRSLADARKAVVEQRLRLSAAADRLVRVGPLLSSDRRQALERLDRLRQTLGYRETLRRGFAVVHGESGLIVTSAEAARQTRFEIEFQDGRVAAHADIVAAPKKRRRKDDEQQSLF